MSQEQLKSLENLEDVLIVQKIERIDPVTINSANDSIKAIQCLCFESGCDCERNLLVEEQEAIRKKQLQMLQADERGKQALLSEIAAIKEKQSHREELLRNRQRALDIERERARKIASLPPPLPKSVRVLLKKNDDEPKLNKPDVERPDLLEAINIKSIEACYRNTENKENIPDPEELEYRQKLREEWDMKAKKRFNEALKKDRQKEEYLKIMKQIQNAELLKRQEMAKNISSNKKGMPCLLSDKIQTARKQVDMEDVAEKIFKKSGAKEHVIEDIEGYQDHYEEKYKHIDSNYEAKMIDCVPSFVKENYDYLLQDDSKFVGGKNFSGLDESNSDVLNQAYIETPPGMDAPESTEEIHHMINNLDRLRSNLETEYEQNIKPLLAAMGSPKKELKDQAVETEPVKVSAEDKAVETDEQIKNVVTSPSPTATFNFTNAGVMAFKRSKPQLPKLSAYEKATLPHMHHREVHFAFPVVSESSNTTESWSPSSYCSLPSKHGIPSFPNVINSPICDICAAEMKKDPVKDHLAQEFLPKSAVPNQEKSDNVTVSSGKTPLSKYVQQLVKKHFASESTESHVQSEDNVKSFSDSCLPTYSDSKTVSPAFEREIIGKSKVGVCNEPDNSKELISLPVKKVLPEEVKRSQFSPLVIEQPLPVTKTTSKASKAEKEILENEDKEDELYLKIKDNEVRKSSNEYSEYEYEAKRIQAIQQVLSRNLPQFALDENDKPEEKNNGKEAKQSTLPAQNEMNFRPYIYHELSTIQEVDSALTASSLQLSHSKLSDTSGIRGEKEVPSKKKDSAEKLKMASLLDPPDSAIAELAKSIHFVPDGEQKVDHQSLETSQTIFTISSTDKSTTSKELLSTPTLASNSRSSVSTSDLTPSLPLTSSAQSVPSVESVENKDIQSRIISGFISDLEVQDAEESDAFHSKQNKKDVPTIISGYISDLDVPQVSTSNISNPDEEKKEKNSVASGYISDLEIQHVSVSNNPKQDRGDTMPLIISGYISDLDVQHITNSDALDPEKGKNYVHKAASRYLNTLEIPEIIKANISHFYQENKNDKYFINSRFIRNVNTPRESDSPRFLPMTPYSDVSNSSLYRQAVYSDLKSDDRMKLPINKDLLSKQEQFSTETSSEKSFKPMTPYSNISSPSESSVKNDCQYESSSSGSFKPMTPHSNVSSPSETSVFISRKDFQYKGSSVGSFRPMTPHSNVSSPSEIATYTFQKNFEAATESLKLMPLYSNLSSTNRQANYIFKTDNQDVYNVENFKPLPPHSNLSSPSDIILSLNDQHKDYANSPVSFRVLTPHSNISSSVSDLVQDNSNSGKLIDRISSENATVKPIIVTFDISTDSFTPNTKQNKSSKAKHLTKLNCNLTVKSHLHKPVSYNRTPPMPRSNMITRATDSRKSIGRSKSKARMRHKGLYAPSTKQFALACSSDFFVPSTNENSTSSNENGKDLISISTANTADINKSEVVFDPLVDTSGDKKKNLEKLSEKKDFHSEATSSDKEMPNEFADEKNSKETRDTQLETGRNFRKQCSNLASSASLCSSTDSMSGISSSKVVFQSTPIKNLSEIIKEPGILEEPDLTLINTQLSCKLDITEVQRGPLISKQLTQPEKNDLTVPSANECVTPTSFSPQFLSSVDTPSMLSFLQHEMSCNQTEQNSVQSPGDNTPDPQNLLQKRKSLLRDVKRSLFQRPCYKERTKRLWNNLEEVKKKNLAEERKKEMEINRRKAKEFSKKLTPKQRRK